MKQITIYCGASKGHSPSYVQKAYDLGKYSAEQGYELAFGAESIGIIGAIQDGVLDHGGKAIGVILKMSDECEITSQRLIELALVDSMRERKNKMTELADVFVMAPGGAGLLGELFEMYSWTQINIHEKPIAIYNTNGFSNPLQTMIDYITEGDFIDPKYHALIPLCDTKESLVESVLNFKPLGIRSYD